MVISRVRGEKLWHILRLKDAGDAKHVHSAIIALPLLYGPLDDLGAGYASHQIADIRQLVRTSARDGIRLHVSLGL